MQLTASQLHALTEDTVTWLSDLISIPAVSREEKAKADRMETLLRSQGLIPRRQGNNLWCLSRQWQPERPTLLLNAHIDTVRPAKGWQRDPFRPSIKEDRIYGLGSNDCGGGLLCLLQAFRLLEQQPGLPWNLVYLASAEEEISGPNGLTAVLPLLPKIDAAIVGEPTGMQPAVAEKGLMVLDVTARGKAGHAAREEGVNALYKALPDIEWFRTHRFEKVSPLLGAVKMTVTVIQAGTQHNVVPDECRFTVDVRANECYSNLELLEAIRSQVHSEVTARSTRLNSSHIDLSHPLVQRAMALGGIPYGSPTLSDQALMPFPSLKLGPGESSRSHTAEEYICRTEISQAIQFYLQLLDCPQPVL